MKLFPSIFTAPFAFYFLINVADVKKSLVDYCDQSSVLTVRRSLDGTQAVLSYTGAVKPAAIAAYEALKGALTYYKVKDMQAVMVTSAWSPPDPPDPKPVPEPVPEPVPVKP